jgi:hypothetical protein
MSTRFVSPGMERWVMQDESGDLAQSRQGRCGGKAIFDLLHARSMAHTQIPDMVRAATPSGAVCRLALRRF